MTCAYFLQNLFFLLSNVNEKTAVPYYTSIIPYHTIPSIHYRMDEDDLEAAEAAASFTSSGQSMTVLRLSMSRK